MLSQFCIKRPIFASVLSILIVIAGLLAWRALPIRSIRKLLRRLFS